MENVFPQILTFTIHRWVLNAPSKMTSERRARKKSHSDRLLLLCNKRSAVICRELHRVRKFVSMYGEGAE